MLIGFDPPEYELAEDRGARALADPPRRARLAPPERRRLPPDRRAPAAPTSGPGTSAIHVEVAVLSFYPAIANGLSHRLYAATQSAIHVLVTHGFLRSLASLDLAESRTGRFRGQ